MELLRLRSDAWGQEVLDGANLELVSWFVVAGVVLIVLHAFVAARTKRRRGKSRG